MPLLALNSEQKRISSWEVEPERMRQEWRCPNCGEVMVFVDAVVKIKHFRHLVLCPYETEPESELHLEIKKFLFDFYEVKGAELEKRIGNKITDVFLPNLNGGTCVEVQLSSISVEEMKEREQNAKSLGYGLIWVFDAYSIRKIEREWGHYSVVYRLNSTHRYIRDTREKIYEYEDGKIFARTYGFFSSRETIYWLKDSKQTLG